MMQGIDAKVNLRASLIKAGALCLITILAGCATEPQVQVRTIRVPVPIACEEPVPDRPGMPTEHLADDANIADFTRAAIAEIARREGYELQLRTALTRSPRPMGLCTSRGRAWR